MTDYPIAPEEAGVGVTDTCFDYGDIRRYGGVADGVTDNSPAIEAALGSFRTCYIPFHPQHAYRFDSTIRLRTNSAVYSNSRGTLLEYHGNGAAFANPHAGTRIYSPRIANLTLSTAHAGTTGLDLDSVSGGHFENLNILHFDTGVRIVSPTAGYSVANRFYNVTVQHANAAGYWIAGLSSNANTFLGCRANGCRYGARVFSSNENHFMACQFEGGRVGVDFGIDTAASFCDRNYVSECRFEANSTVNLEVSHGDVRDTYWRGNYHVNGNQYSDAGTRTHVEDYYPNSTASEAFSAATARMSTDGCYKWERTAPVTTPNVPMAVFRDSNSGSGTPTTIKAVTERIAGNFFEGERAGTTYIALAADGTIVLEGGAQIRHGTGEPQGEVSAPVGSIFLRSDGEPGETFWVKEEGGDGPEGWYSK